MTKSGFEKRRLEILCKDRARELKIARDWEQTYRQYIVSKIKKNRNESGYTTCFVNQPLELCTGDWIADDYGVKKNEFDFNTGRERVKEASRMPILPVELLENMDSGIEKVNIAYLKDSLWRNVICERVTVASNTKIVELANKGIDVTTANSKLLVEYLYDCITLNQDIIPRYKSISRLGWVENKFMPYDLDIKFDGEKENKYLFESVCQKGDFEKWVEFTSKLRKNKYLRLQMATSFASVLVEKVNALPFILHLWGGTGSGKTVGMIVAMSIWGNPIVGKLTRTMNMTQNSMLSTAAFLRNIPFAGDELQIIKDKFNTYDQLIMKVTEGVDRGRMSYDRINETKIWKCTFLFTGEDPCTKDSSGGGVKNRVIEIDCTDGRVVENGNEVINFISENYGHAGIVFIEGIKKEDVLTRYIETFKSVMKECDTTEKQAMSMSLILLADELSCKYIYKNEVPLKVSDIKEFMFSEDEVDVTERAYQLVMNLIECNINKFKKSDSSEVWGRIDDDSGEILVNKKVLSDIMNNENLDLNSMLKSWAKKGYVVKNTQGKYAHRTTCHTKTADYIKFNTTDVTDIFPE
jgi:uncharacterized protein (DUF927 family)